MRKLTGLLIAILAITLANSAQAAPQSPIAPGDIIFSEFFNDWHKLDPTTGQVTELVEWNQGLGVPGFQLTPRTTIAFDTDGSLLYDAFDGTIVRLNPLTGVRSTVTNQFPPRGFVVESNGDLLIAQIDGIVRFSRATQSTAYLTGRPTFSARGIARSDDGRVYVTDFFSGILEIDSVSGARSPVTDVDFRTPDLMAVQPSGQLIVNRFLSDALYRVDPDSGDVDIFTNVSPAFVQGFAADAAGNIWLSSTDGIFKYPSVGGPGALVAEDMFFRPGVIAVVPLDWTPPPVPEPCSAALVCLGSVCVLLRR